MLQELIDPTDTSYEAQRRIAASDTTLDALLQVAGTCAGGPGCVKRCLAIANWFTRVSVCEHQARSCKFCVKQARRLVPAPQMLDDESEAVVVAAAAAVAAVADHAGVVRDRLEAGHFVATPERVPLNPVQGDMGAVDGLIRCAGGAGGLANTTHAP